MVAASACGLVDEDEAEEPLSEPTVVVDGTLATVARMIDGDSLELTIVGDPDIAGDRVETRLIGINAPEFLDCQGPAAKEALDEVLAGRTMTLEHYGFDRFGRLLAELFVDGESVNQALVRAGWALALHGDEKDWTAEMAEAAEDGLGMWDAPDLCEPPAEDLRIAAIEPDPPGPDDEVLDQEWIEIENAGDAPTNLAGWIVRDESTGNRFEFESFTLGPGERVRLRTGCGADSDTDLHWCSPNGVWSNRGETALLLAPNGAIVDHLFVD